jgi:hypothetical protein
MRYTRVLGVYRCGEGDGGGKCVRMVGFSYECGILGTMGLRYP